MHVQTQMQVGSVNDIPLPTRLAIATAISPSWDKVVMCLNWRGITPDLVMADLLIPTSAKCAQHFIELLAKDAVPLESLCRALHESGNANVIANIQTNSLT